MMEDNIGDIIIKACQIRKITPAAAVIASGLTMNEFNHILKTGKLEKEINYEALGRLLGISPDKLRIIANGWQPVQVDLSRWNIKQFVSTEGFSANCYLLWDKNGEAVLFDTGFNYTEIADFIKSHALNLKSLFITHKHHDHCKLVPQFIENFPQLVCYNSAEGTVVHDGEVISFGSLNINVIYVPSHTDDSFAYFVSGFPDNLPGVVFVGDIIFAGSVGRITHLEPEKALRTIKEKILGLPSQTLICPGHGFVTTVGEELRNNPFF